MFPCTKCDEAFQTNQELKTHARTHIGERPFKCDQCDRDFAREIMLTLHKAQHSKVDMETKLDKTLESQRKRKFLVTKQECEPKVEKLIDNPFGDENIDSHQLILG